MPLFLSVIRRPQSGSLLLQGFIAAEGMDGFHQATNMNFFFRRHCLQQRGQSRAEPTKPFLCPQE